MKYLRSFNESTKFLTNHDEVEHFMLNCVSRAVFSGRLVPHERSKFTINPDGSVDVDGNVFLYPEFMGNLTRLPIKFRNVTKTFIISGISNLTTLEGSPDTCKDFFVTWKRDLYFKSDPKTCPKKLKDLRGGPKYVSGDYSVEDIPITSLEGAPEHCGNSFICSLTNITSLKGSPKTVGGHFYADNTKITDLVGGPEKVGHRMDLRFTNLTSLEGAPKQFGSINVLTNRNTLWDPGNIRNCEGDFVTCSDDPLEEIIELFVTNDDGVNYDDLDHTERSNVFKLFKDSLDYNYIRKTSTGKPQIILFRLKEALDEIGIVEPVIVGLYDFPKDWDLVDENGARVDFWGRPK